MKMWLINAYIPGIGISTYATLDQNAFTIDEVYDLVAYIGRFIPYELSLVDGRTREIVYEYRADPDEPPDIDDDCGYDPYLGCYSDDC